MTNKGDKKVAPENKIVDGYLDKPWWRNQLQIIDLPSPIE